MRHWIFALVAGVLVGFGFGFGLSFLWRSETKSPTVVALINVDIRVRTELTKYPRIKVVDQVLIDEGIRVRKDEPEMTRNRKVCQELGVNLMVVGELHTGEIDGKKWRSGSVKLIEVETGALRWSKDWRDDGDANLPQLVAEEVRKLIQ